jgi:hypothetical protein
MVHLVCLGIAGDLHIKCSDRLEHLLEHAVGIGGFHLAPLSQKVTIDPKTRPGHPNVSWSWALALLKRLAEVEPMDSQGLPKELVTKPGPLLDRPGPASQQKRSAGTKAAPGTPTKGYK